ncbi:hypothetical protein ROSINTL182_08890 [Roseburia intestinalis L1-82]|uniref:Uncharacterized protein n=1 Tax=Roseburia intestinalis L1-82 TaxID=536231 RepID=C7GG30_9FIRM|nr:hypothetical protein ROSINTL182_08890 [Roseburia intestinalis L1-82]
MLSPFSKNLSNVFYCSPCILFSDPCFFSRFSFVLFLTVVL